MPSTAAEDDGHGAVQKRVVVAVGVITNARGQVFLTQRAATAHQGGLWEFPGGKVEPGETVFAALQRELHEELGIQVRQATPLLRIRHDYRDKLVLLDVWRVADYDGEPHSMHGLPQVWAGIDELARYDFPEANRNIVLALRLAPQMLVTGAWRTLAEIETKLEAALAGGIRLVQLRAPDCDGRDWAALVQCARLRCTAHRATLVLNTSVEQFRNNEADGLHLTSERLLRCDARPVPREVVFGASCHTLEEIRHANRLDTDYIVLGPVRATLTHPGAVPLGLPRFAALATESRSLVYALGGMKPAHTAEVVQAGGYGIAGISAWWNEATA